MRSVICALVLLCASPAFANTVDVSYTVEGHAGDWTLDFSLIHGFHPPVDYALYKFGVSVPQATIISQPLEWHPIGNDTWQFSQATNGPYPVAPVIMFQGTTLDGFLIHSTAQEAPMQVAWTSVGSASPDNGRYIGNFFSNGLWVGEGTVIAASRRGIGLSTLFHGTSNGELIASEAPSPAAVPEPGTWLLVGIGMLAWIMIHPCCPRWARPDRRRP